MFIAAIFMQHLFYFIAAIRTYTIKL